MTRFNDNFKAKPCSAELKIGQDRPFEQQSFVHFVRDAVYAFAYALHNLHRDLCGDFVGVCKAMEHVDGDHLTEYLKRVSFKG